MPAQTVNSVKLGLFVLAGLVLLVFALYALGKNRSLFSADLELKTHFKAVNGLVKGNNVRYSGIDIGTVKEVTLLNDTVIEVKLSVNKKMETIIRTNAVASLGTDGLIGNRVVNVAPGKGEALFVKNGDLLVSKEEVSTDEMLLTLRRTNDNVAVISEELLLTLRRINNSATLSEFLDDRSIPINLSASLVHLRQTTKKASSLMTDAMATLALASEGRGTLATLLTDTTLALEVRQAFSQIKEVEASAEQLANELNHVTLSVDKDINQGQGPVYALMKDSLMAGHLRQTIENAANGTAAFNENMEALKHNFLFRRYFRKLEKDKRKIEPQKARQ